MKISIVGQGKLGACMTAAFASRGFEVLAIDINQETVDAINDGRSPDWIQEPRLDGLLTVHKEHITATTDFSGIVDTDATFVIVPTPTPDEDGAASEGVEPGAFSLRYVLAAMDEIGTAIRDKEYHLVVLTSTVMLGDCDSRVIPALEQASGLMVGDNLGFCYSPEFIALGSVISDFLDPDIILIGESDERAGQTLEDMYKKLFKGCATCAKSCAQAYPPFHHMFIKNAELAKVSLNSYVTMKITFANQTAAMCERFEGGDCDAVLAAIGDDRRVGSLYLKGAIGYGGPCFPRDNRALATIMTSRLVDASLPLLIDNLNYDTYVHIVESLDCGQYETISILGLAYKPGTNVIEESQAVMMARRLASCNYDVYVWDEIAVWPGDDGNAWKTENIWQVDDMQECASYGDVVILTLPLPSFYKLKFSAGQTVYDCWRVLRDVDLGEGVEYVGLGLG